MSKKSNPLNLRLGILNSWSFYLQNYGKSPSVNFFINFFILYIDHFLDTFLSKKNLPITFKEIWWNHKFIYFNLYSLELKKENYLNILKEINIVTKLWKIKNLNIRIYKNSYWFTNSFLTNNYLHFLSNNCLIISPKKLFGILILLLTKQINQTKISYFKNGPKKIILKGFRIKLIGRFENTTNKMAKVIEYKIGSLALVQLDNNINYLENQFNTKLGLCNLKIWLFFKIIEN